MNAPTICDPSLTILIAAFLALSIFVGVLAAMAVIQLLRRIKSHREQRLTLLHARVLRRR